ncbi:Ig-like domain-containing protein [Deinococcus yunweiensis]|uniref:Ig-like domain-containing protein n=1 Tax=Deinococcus yunweiensis TaxID=367282 RepID=UPI00398E4D56
MGAAARHLAISATTLRERLERTQLPPIVPTVAVSATPTALTTTGTVTVTVEATDAEAIQLYRDGTLVATQAGSALAFSEPVTFANNGPRTYRAVARSINREAMAATTVDVAIPVPDTTPPEVTLAISTASVTAPGTVLLTALAMDNVGVASVAFYRGSTLLATDVTAPYGVSVPLAFADNGSVTFTAVATDTSGNTTISAAKVVTVAIPDTTAPQVAISASQTLVTAAGTLVLTATASDAGGVTSVKFYRGTTLLATDTVAPYATSEAITAASNGTYTYRAVATDQAGNTAESSVTVTVNVGRIFPTGALARYTMAAGTDAGVLYDSSGNGHDRPLGTGAGADAADPTYDGVGGLVFGGDDRVSLDLADVTPDLVTVLIQAKADAAMSASRRLFGVRYADGSIWEIYREIDQGILAVRTRVNGVYAYPNFDQAWPLGRALFLGVRVNRATGQFSLSADGGPWQAYRTVAALTDTPVAAYLGADSSGANGWQGTLGEATIYGRGLTDAEVADAYAMTPPLATPAPPPPSAAALTNDGDAFTLSWPASSSLLYVVYSAYAETGRMFVPISPWVQGTTFRDPNVYDGRHVWYQVYRLVNGVEVLHAELNGIQPNRVWESAASLPPGRYENRNFRSLDPNVNDVALTNGQTGTQLYEFINCCFAGMRHALGGFRNRVRGRGLRVWRLHPGGTGVKHGRGLDLQEFRHVDVQYSYFEDVQANYFTLHDNRGAAGDTLLFKFNFVRNVVGMLTDGAGGYKTGADDFYRSQAWQVSSCRAGLTNKDGTARPYTTSLRGAEIMWNLVSNEPGYSRAEDDSSMYKVDGQPDSKVKVQFNMLDGAYCYRPTVHTEFSGGGLMIGDEGGNYISQRFNRVTRISNYGIALLNGHDNESSDNRVVRSPFLYSGERIAVAPPSGLVAAQMWDYNGVGSAMKDNHMDRNVLAFQYQKADGTLVRKPKYVPMAGKNGNTFDDNVEFTADVTVAMEWAELAGWRDDLRAAGLGFGPQSFAA